MIIPLEENTVSNRERGGNFVKVVLFLFLVVGVGIFFGYLKPMNEIVYFSEKYNETLTFFYNDTAIAVGPNYSLSGNWQRTDEKELIITWVPSGKVHVFYMSGNSLIDKNNDKWVCISSLSLANASQG